MDTHTLSVVFNMYLQHSEHLNYLPRTAGQLPLLPLTALDLSSSSFSRYWLCLRMPIPCLLATLNLAKCPRCSLAFCSSHFVLGLPHFRLSLVFPITESQHYFLCPDWLHATDILFIEFISPLPSTSILTEKLMDFSLFQIHMVLRTNSTHE